MSGTGSNRRSGLHFFADNPTLNNRGNSYLAWFRADDNSVQIYKVENDVLNLVANVSHTINVNTWYDFKVTFSPTTGEIIVFIDKCQGGIIHRSITIYFWELHFFKKRRFTSSL